MAALSASQENEPQAALRWCASIAPPAPLLAHFAAHQLTLGSSATQRVFAPTRLTTISHAAVRIVGKRAALDGRRVGVLHPDPGAADAFAQTLRARGGEVAVLSLDPTQLARAVALDPEVIVVEPRHVTAACWPALEAVFQHPQLRWTSVLVAAPEVMDGVEAHDWPGLCAQVQLLCADYEAAAARARSGEQVDMELESLGPARVLRLLVQAGKSYRAVFSTSALTVEVDVAEGLIVGARGAFGKVLDDALLGTPGLEALLNETSGLVRARPVSNPAVTNIMSPLDAALAAAGHGVRRVERTANTIISVRPRPSVLAQGAPSSVRTIRDRTLIGMPAPKLPAEAAALMAEVGSATAPEGTRSLRPSATATLPPPSLASRLSLAAKRSLPSLTLPPKFSLPSFSLPVRASMPENDQATAAPELESSARAPEVLAGASEPEAVDQRAVAEAPPVAAERSPQVSRRVSSPSANEPTVSMDLVPEPKPNWRLRGAIALSGLLALGLGAQAGSYFAGETAPQATASAPRAPERRLPAGQKAERGALAAAGAVDEGSKVGEPSTDAEKSQVAALHENSKVAEQGKPEERAEEAPEPAAAPSPASREAPPEPAARDSADAEATSTAPVREAERPSKRVTAGDHRRAIAIAKQATLLVRKGESEKAKALYESALAIAPDNPRALWGRTRIALSENDASTAETFARRLSIARPRSASSFLLLGDAQAAAGHQAAARASFEKAAELGSPEARLRLSGVEAK